MARKSKLRNNLEHVGAIMLATTVLITFMAWRSGMINKLEHRFEGHWIEPLVQMMKQ